MASVEDGSGGGVTARAARLGEGADPVAPVVIEDATTILRRVHAACKPGEESL